MDLYPRKKVVRHTSRDIKCFDYKEVGRRGPAKTSSFDTPIQLSEDEKDGKSENEGETQTKEETSKVTKKRRMKSIARKKQYDKPSLNDPSEPQTSPGTDSSHHLEITPFIGLSPSSKNTFVKETVSENTTPVKILTTPTKAFVSPIPTPTETMIGSPTSATSSASTIPLSIASQAVVDSKEVLVRAQNI